MLQMSMSKLSLKVLLGVFALMFSASVGLSAECKDDPNECTPKSLCEVATQVINDNKVWSEEASAAEHITFVKELGMECGVVEITDPCDLDPNECKVKQLCEKATTGDDGSKAWSAEAEAYVELAKEYKLECGVNRNLANSKLNNIKIYAFQLKNYYQKLDLKTRKKIQRKLYSLSYYNVLPDRHDGLWREKLEKGLIQYARAKALMFAPPDKLIASLNVKVEKTAGFCTSDTASQCSDKELCSWASSDGKWSLIDTLQPYVKQAQLRGLSCRSRETLASYFKKQSRTKRKQIQYALKDLGFYTMNIDGLWGNGTKRAFATFKDKVGVNSYTNPEALKLLLEMVKVPTKFAEPKRTTSNKSTKKSGNSKLTKIVDNPSVSADQAIAICVPQANLAGSNASNSFNSGGYGSTMRCSGFGNSFNCNSSANSGGVWGGFADGIGKGLARRQASNAVLRSCLAQYGWKTK
jgi:hypothetical protein